MKRLSVCMLFGCVCALGLGVLSCEAAEQKTRTLTDANGREVELNEDIQKAIVSNRYNLEIIRAVGAIDQVEAIDSLAYTNEAFWPEFTSDDVYGKGTRDLDYEKIISYITKICKRDPRTGKVVTGGIVSCRDSSWLLSWTINRQGQFKGQKKDEICVWVYSLFTDVPGNYVKKPMKECTGKEITEEWLYHLGIPVDEIPELAEHHANCTPTMMPYITAFFMPRSAGDRPDVIPDGCVNAAFLGQFAETPRDTIFTTEYSVRTAMEAVYGLCGVDRGVPEVWGSVYDVRELLDSTVKLMDGKSPLEMPLPKPLEMLKKPLLKKTDKTIIGKLLRDHGVLKDGMI